MSLKGYRRRLAHKRWKMWRNRCHLVLPRSKIQALLIKSCWISTVGHISRVSFGAKCASNPEDTTRHIENSPKSTQWRHNFSWTAANNGDGGTLQVACFLVGTDTSSGGLSRDNGARLQEDGQCLARLLERPSWCVTWS